MNNSRVTKNPNFPQKERHNILCTQEMAIWETKTVKQNVAFCSSFSHAFILSEGSEDM